jgi:diadenosine tetraphosphate (Ap4A) HIT family hydrolase/SOS-response transcriptional repressor LexA
MTDRPCPFCNPEAVHVVGGNDLAFALRDSFPVSPGHTLIIPRRHVASWFDATPEERDAILALTDVLRARFDASWPRPDGYNIGINVGEAAGQTVMHLHVHLIPRFRGDVDDPRGGVRHVIPEKGNYHRAGHVPRATREPSLTTGGTTDPFLSHLKPLIAQATSVDILAAFVQQSGVDLVRSPLVSALHRRARIRVLTGDYLNITQAQAIRSLRDLERATRIPDDDEGVLPPGTIDVRVVEVESLRAFARSFHPKCWVLEGLAGGVVVDEVHHAAASTYRAILRRLAPRFLLGLTATPERADAGDILGLFDDHVAYTADIGEGIGRGHLVPFRYFGIKDTVDYEPIPWRNGRFDPELLALAVATRERMEATWAAWQAHPATRTLVFCCSVAHADFVKTWLLGKGLRVVAVHTGPGSDDRDDALERLDAGALDAVCAVDLFNEGVDVPRVDRVVMLRPTESSLLFLQQLGRGLRRPEGAEKTDLLVLDFVGNHRMFLDRVRQLLHLCSAGQTRSVAELIRTQGKVALAGGCSIALDLEAVDLLRRLLPSGEGHVFVRTYREVRDARGTRPTLGEMYRMCRNPAALQGFAGWFDFVDSENDLTADEKRVLSRDRVGPFLQALERREAMDKCFKMVTLQALLEAETFMKGMPVPGLARRSHEILLRSPELFRDIEGVRELPDPRAPKPATWERYWRKNPIHFWTEGASARRGQAWFLVQGDAFQPAFSVPQDRVPTLEALVAEVVDYRLARYRRHRKEEREAGRGSFVCKIIHNNQGPILKLPDRKKVAGIPEGDTDVRLPDGRYWRFHFVSIACNLAHPVGSSANQLPDLLRTWFGPHAGASGTMFQVRFRPSPAGWWIEPVDAEGAEIVPQAGRGQVVVFPTLQAAAGWETAELVADDVPPDVVSLPGPSVPGTFAVRVTGSSMQGWPSVIRDGDWLVLRFARSMGIGALDGRIVVVRRGDPGGGVTFHVKRVVRTDTGLALRSDHPDVGDRPVQAGDEVFAEIVQVVRPEDIGPATGTLLQVSEIAAAFGIQRAPAPGRSRVDGHLFLVVDSLSSPDRVELESPDRRPGETAFVLGRLDGDCVRYLGVGRWSAGGWEIPEVSFETWRTLGRGLRQPLQVPGRHTEGLHAVGGHAMGDSPPETHEEQGGKLTPP